MYSLPADDRDNLDGSQNKNSAMDFQNNYQYGGSNDYNNATFDELPADDNFNKMNIQEDVDIDDQQDNAYPD